MTAAETVRKVKQLLQISRNQNREPVPIQCLVIRKNRKKIGKSGNQTTNLFLLREIKSIHLKPCDFHVTGNPPNDFERRFPKLYSSCFHAFSGAQSLS